MLASEKILDPEKVLMNATCWAKGYQAGSPQRLRLELHYSLNPDQEMDRATASLIANPKL